MREELDFTLEAVVLSTVVIPTFFTSFLGPPRQAETAINRDLVQAITGPLPQEPSKRLLKLWLSYFIGVFLVRYFVCNSSLGGSE